jgi:hypothetical protein
MKKPSLIKDKTNNKLSLILYKKRKIKKIKMITLKKKIKINFKKKKDHLKEKIIKKKMKLKNLKNNN